MNFVTWEKYRHMSPRMILASVFILSALPLMLVKIFPAQLQHVIAPVSYVAIHNATELFSIMVSLSIFGVGWFTYDQTGDRHTLFLSVAFLAISFMDLLHTMSNAAMPAFITPNSSNKSIQFWIAVRLFAASAFLGSAYIYPASRSRWLSRTALMTIVLIITGMVFAGVVFFPSFVPVMFIPGRGLTPFKMVSEYAIIFLLVLASMAYWKRMARTGDRLHLYYISSFIISIFSELTFSSYISVFDTYNVLGHIYKVAAFSLVYGGIFIVAVKAPHRRLLEARGKLQEEIIERKRIEEEIRVHRDRLQEMVKQRTAELEASNEGLRRENAERRQVETTLRRKDRDLEEAQRLARIGSWYWDAQTDATTGSDELLRIYGLDPATQRMPAFKEQEGRLYPPQDWQRVNEAVQRTVETGVGHELDVQAVRDGATIWVTTRSEAVRDAGGRIVGLRGTVQDITERKRAEEELRLAYEKLRAFFDHRVGGIGIVIANAQGDIMEANDYYLEILGCTREELETGTVRWREMTPPEWLPADEKALAQLREHGVCDTYEKEYVRRDGARVPVLITDVMLPGEGGEILAFVLDITKRKRAEEDLTNRTIELEAANRELESFAYSVAHDLRAPLRAINGFSEMLVRNVCDRLDNEEKRKLNVIRENARRMGSLIDDLLSFSRLGRQALSASVINMEDLFNQVWEECSDRAGRTIELKIGDFPQAFGDRGLVKQVLANLLSNAVKFTKLREKAFIEIGGRENEKENIYYIKDNGVGFDLRYSNKLFGVFQRLHHEDEFEGTGVGLALVQRIIHRHGGRVWAEAKVNEGATFFFSLPSTQTR